MKEITVCLLEGIGNTVMTTPMIEALKKLGYKVKFLINPRGKNLAHMIGKHEYKIGNNTNKIVYILLREIIFKFLKKILLIPIFNYILQFILITILNQRLKNRLKVFIF